MAYQFVPGWDPDRAIVARQELLASNRYCTVAPAQPYPPAFSLSGSRLRVLIQGQAGSCWLHSSVQLAETSGNALGYEIFPICRRLVGYVGKQLEGGGNPADGGDPSDSIAAMVAAKGAGIAHESLWPYDENGSKWALRQALGTKPPANVYADGSKCHLVAPVVVDSDDDSRTMIAAKHGVAQGQWWPSGWDSQQTFMTSIGHGGYGHSLYEMGYVVAGYWPGDYGKYDWWQLDNWHTELYPPLPDNLATMVPGYKPSSPNKTSDFWVRGDVYRTVQGYRGFTRISATDLQGIATRIVVPAMDDAFIV